MDATSGDHNVKCVCVQTTATRGNTAQRDRAKEETSGIDVDSSTYGGLHNVTGLNILLPWNEAG